MATVQRIVGAQASDEIPTTGGKVVGQASVKGGGNSKIGRARAGLCRGRTLGRQFVPGFGGILLVL